MSLNKLPQVTSREARKSPVMFASGPPSPKYNAQSVSLPTIKIFANNKLSYRGVRILNEAEKKETIGYKVKSLFGVLSHDQSEDYLRILRGDKDGLYTGENKNDLLGVVQNDRKKISTDIRVYLHKRGPLNAAKSRRCEEEEENEKVAAYHSPAAVSHERLSEKLRDKIANFSAQKASINNKSSILSYGVNANSKSTKRKCA